MQDILEIENELLQISKENKLFRFNLEKSKTNDLEKKKLIEQILNEINNVKKEEVIIDKMDDLEKSFYRQTWGKLNNDLKLDKITEYMIEHNLEEEEKIELINRFNNNQFKTAKYIDYDIKKCKILNIK
jgi:archaellum biogenesis ATPase FlaH